MKTIATTSTVLLVLMLSAGTAHAFKLKLVTPPLVTEGDNGFECHIVNVSNQPHAVTIQAIDVQAAVLTTLDVTLEGGKAASASAAAGQNTRYCKFIVDGRRFQFRADAIVHDPGIGTVSAVPAR